LAKIVVVIASAAMGAAALAQIPRYRWLSGIQGSLEHDWFFLAGYCAVSAITIGIIFNTYHVLRRKEK
jgi:hypothetical protein